MRHLRIIRVRILAIPTLTAYALSETFGWHQGLEPQFKTARGFYAVVILSTVVLIVIDFAGINPVKALVWSAIVNGLLALFCSSPCS